VWSSPFDDPVILPNGRKLFTLMDVGKYITRLPKAEQDAPEWQAAMEALILVADLSGPTMFARIAVMRAMNRKHVREFNLDRKPHHWGRPAVDHFLIGWLTASPGTSASSARMAENTTPATTAMWYPTGLSCIVASPKPR